ncbi:hypothetical protein EYF80_015962 [Liparis tanakae]|uniref:Uncharacterized protein n=1 Tax=Liparis tanakae TaxID=230148 RepID=A0A4Z2I8R2_9TELE|nr:hypothetical protein EYF80_015962 [Liparis tanakae]
MKQIAIAIGMVEKPSSHLQPRVGMVANAKRTANTEPTAWPDSRRTTQNLGRAFLSCTEDRDMDSKMWRCGLVFEVMLDSRRQHGRKQQCHTLLLLLFLLFSRSAPGQGDGPLYESGADANLSIRGGIRSSVKDLC